MPGIGQWPAEAEEAIINVYADQIAEKVTKSLIEGAFRIPQEVAGHLKAQCHGSSYWCPQAYIGPGPLPLVLEPQITHLGHIQLTLRDVNGACVWRAVLRP